jgi:hypothetical protein
MISARILIALASVPLALSAQSRTEASKTEKNVTFISAETSADGRSEIAREKLLDCIQSLPNPDRLEAQVTSRSVYVQGVNGEAGRNEWIKSYTARMDVTYLTKEKDLIIVTTRNVNGQPPVLREVDKVLRHTETFLSNSTEGDAFSGRSDRSYHFTTAAAAVKDVRDRARVWVSQQEASVCPAK